jgi:hypothetical protein
VCQSEGLTVRYRVCSQAACPELTTGQKCAVHTRSRDRARGTRQARGYGLAHEALRAQLAPIVARGTELCARCGERITPWQAWHLDHTDDRQGYLGPSHASCNTRAARGAGPRTPGTPGG